VNELEVLSSTLDSGSDFVTGLETILNDTESIDQSVYLATETLALLRDTLALPENRYPGTFHECLFCSGVSSILDPVVNTLSGSLGQQLKDARQAARDQLSEANREEMKQLLNTAVQPLTDVKDLVRDAFEPLVTEGDWVQIRDDLFLAEITAVFSVTVLALMFGFSSLIGIQCCCLRERDHEGKYIRLPSRCGCCNWCCGWFLVLLAFFLGGTLQLLSLPVSAVCLTLDELSGQLLTTTAGALDVKSMGDGFTILTDIVDQCVNPADPNTPSNFADILFIKDSSSTSRTFREKISQDVEGVITGRLNNVTSSISSGGSASLANDTSVVTLTDKLVSDGGSVEEHIVPRIAEFTRDLQSKQPPVAVPNATWQGWNTTLGCADAVLDYGSFRGVTSYLAWETSDSLVTLQYDPCGTRGP
jgi:hypothetical protein